MVAAGVLDEVRALVARGLDPALPAMKAVGLRELASHLSGERTLEEALSAAKQETRRYAKRQLTWWRNQLGDWERLSLYREEEEPLRQTSKATPDSSAASRGASSGSKP